LFIFSLCNFFVVSSFAIDQNNTFDAISTPVELEGRQVKVGASIGISCFPIYSNDVITLMSTADSAMYVAKGKGKNSFSVYRG
jgi:diguanylate cyclase (GGDEF)-like protein